MKALDSTRFPFGIAMALAYECCSDTQATDRPSHSMKIYVYRQYSVGMCTGHEGGKQESTVVPGGLSDHILQVIEYTVTFRQVQFMHARGQDFHSLCRRRWLGLPT